MTVTIASFYRFAPLPDAAARRAPLLALLREKGVKGTILLATEGVNGTVSGPGPAVEAVLDDLRAMPGFEALEAKISHHTEHPFQRTKVKLKREIIPFGKPCDPAAATAAALDAAQWNTLLANPETIVLDTRNAYEVEHGTFEGAVNPHIRHFRDLPDYIEKEMAQHKDRPIATFCTGGVRCEKLTSWMIEQGFTRVFQLDGGILKYLRHCPPAQSRWQGQCFVFDERVAIE